MKTRAECRNGIVIDPVVSCSRHGAYIDGACNGKGLCAASDSSNGKCFLFSRQSADIFTVAIIHFAEDFLQTLPQANAIGKRSYRYGSVHGGMNNMKTWTEYPNGTMIDPVVSSSCHGAEIPDR